MWCWKKVRREQPESPRRAPVPGLAVVRKSKIFVMTRERSSLEPRSSLRSGAYCARVPGPHLALSVLQVRQPCPSPGRGMNAAPGRAVAERSGRVIRGGRRESGEVWGVNRERLRGASDVVLFGGLKGRGAVAWPERALSERRRSEDISLRARRARRGLSVCPCRSRFRLQRADRGLSRCCRDRSTSCIPRLLPLYLY